MSRERAIKFYKDFLDHLYQQRRDPKDYIDNVDEQLKRWKLFLFNCLNNFYKIIFRSISN